MLKHIAIAAAAAMTCGAFGAYAQTSPTTPSPTTQRPATTTDSKANQRTTSTGDFSKSGNISADALMDTKIRNKNNETVGEIENVYLDKSGAIQEVVVSVGGFLGVGEKHVAVKWSEIQIERDGNDLKLTTDLTKDSLKSMPDYEKEQAAAPATKK